MNSHTHTHIDRYMAEKNSCKIKLIQKNISYKKNQILLKNDSSRDQNERARDSQRALHMCARLRSRLLVAHTKVVRRIALLDIIDRRYNHHYHVDKRRVYAKTGRARRVQGFRSISIG